MPQSGPRHILLTRPEPDARRMVPMLEARGCRVTVAPLIAIEPVAGPAPETGDVQAILFTSANGIRAFAERSLEREVVVFAVGDTTAAEARGAGFARVRSAGGDVNSLAALVAAECHPENGPLLHAAGRDVAGDLAGALGIYGFEVRRTVLYRATAARTLTPELTAALAGTAIDIALFFSPRTASTFVTLVRYSSLADACRAMEAICLSPAVAAALGGLTWKTVSVAREPTLVSLLACLDERLDRHD